jgi:hypothetical protein
MLPVSQHLAGISFYMLKSWSWRSCQVLEILNSLLVDAFKSLNLLSWRGCQMLKRAIFDKYSKSLHVWFSWRDQDKPWILSVSFFKPGRFHFWNKLRNYIVGKYIYEHEWLRFSSCSMFFCDHDCFMALIPSAFLHIACVFWKCLPSLNCLNIMMFALHQESNLVKHMSQLRSTVWAWRDYQGGKCFNFSGRNYQSSTCWTYWIGETGEVANFWQE